MTAPIDVDEARKRVLLEYPECDGDLNRYLAWAAQEAAKSAEASGLVEVFKFERAAIHSHLNIIVAGDPDCRSGMFTELTGLIPEIYPLRKNADLTLAK